jgi:hypothetical protein
MIPAPTAAERIRSACVRADGALLAVEGMPAAGTPVHHLLADGSFAVTVPVDGDAAGIDDGTPAMLELTDAAPVPLREPVRALVWARGRLRRVPLPAAAALLDSIAADDPNPALLQVQTARTAHRGPHPHDTCYALWRLQLVSVVVADGSGAEPVGVGELLGARPDPFSAMERCWLAHLDTAHPELIARLAARVPARLRRGTVHPLGLDRYGVRLRVEGADGDHDVRLPFHRPVDDARGLSQAIRVLLGCPFRNGLRARRS